MLTPGKRQSWDASPGLTPTPALFSGVRLLPKGLVARPVVQMAEGHSAGNMGLPRWC